MKESYSRETVGVREPAWTGQTIRNVNLVLEGGAMRAQFTGGVLDYLMDHDVWCKNVYGTSAGSLCGYNYVAGDVGRTCYLNVKYGPDPRYMSLRNLALYGSVFTRDFMFGAVPNELDPFDYSAFDNSPMTLTAVCSNIETGEAEYHRLENGHDIDWLVASCSMPLLTKIVDIDGRKLLDGGTCDSVALLRSMAEGNTQKHIVVLTHDANYVRKPDPLLPLMRRAFADYPRFLERCERRHDEYNATYAWIRSLHEKGRVFMIQPPEPVTVNNLERDPDKLFALWEQGYAQMAAQFDDLMAYLEN